MAMPAKTTALIEHKREVIVNEYSDVDSLSEAFGDMADDLEACAFIVDTSDCSDCSCDSGSTTET